MLLAISINVFIKVIKFNCCGANGFQTLGRTLQTHCYMVQSIQHYSCIFSNRFTCRPFLTARPTALPLLPLITPYFKAQASLEHFPREDQLIYNIGRTPNIIHVGEIHKIIEKIIYNLLKQFFKLTIIKNNCLIIFNVSICTLKN